MHRGQIPDVCPILPKLPIFWLILVQFIVFCVFICVFLYVRVMGQIARSLGLNYNFLVLLRKKVICGWLDKIGLSACQFQGQVEVKVKFKVNEKVKCPRSKGLSSNISSFTE